MEAKAASGGDDSPEHERGYFDAPFGVRFGLLVDTEVNFGAPTLSLMRAGCDNLETSGPKPSQQGQEAMVVCAALSHYPIPRQCFHLRAGAVDVTVS